MQYLKSKRTPLTCHILLAAAVLCASATAQAQESPQVWKKRALPMPFLVSDGKSNAFINPATVAPGQPLYDRRSFKEMAAKSLPPVPITAPDGHHIIWSEWASVKGTARVTCTEEGTRVAVWLRNLIPNGLYTLWRIVWESPGPTEMPAEALPPHMIGLGPLGPADGSISGFRASDTGYARTVIVVPPGKLGMFGSLGDCAPLDTYEWHVVGLYHYDDQTHGSVLGPQGTMAEQFAFVF